MAGSTLNIRQPLPYFNLTLRSDAREGQQLSTRSGVLRAARWEASGPRDQKVAKVAEFIFGRSQRRTKTERQRSISTLRIRGLRADRWHGDLAISLSAQSLAKSTAQLTAQIQASCSAQRGSKTATGFRTQRTVTAPSPAQFSVPCPLHCGSAFAPPLFRAPARFNYFGSLPK